MLQYFALYSIILLALTSKVRKAAQIQSELAEKLNNLINKFQI